VSPRARLALLVSILLGACSVFTGEVPLDQSAELIAQGGEEPLRDDPRPIRGQARVLLVALDGVGRTNLRAAIAADRLPAVRRWLGDPVDETLSTHGYDPEGVLSILPSTTMAAWSSVFTGEPPARTGVPGNEWFERESEQLRAPAPVSVTGMDHTLRMYTESWLGARIETATLYEQLDVRSHVSMMPVHRGADLLTTASGSDIAQVLSVLAEGVFGRRGLEREAFSELDEDSVDEALDGIEAHGVPDLQVVYFPGVDLVTHSSDPPIDAQQRHLEEIIGPGLERILREYERRGLAEQTYLLVIADHGHTPVTEAGAISTDGDADPPAILEAVGFRMRPFTLETSEVAYSAVVAYQGGLAYVYLADRSTCPTENDDCDWAPPPRRDEDVLVAARAFAQGPLADRLSMVVVPDRERDALWVVDEDGALEPLRAHLRRHPRPTWLDPVRRLRELALGPYGDRAGDVILISRLDAALPAEERTYFSAPSHSWHGGPTQMDSEVPLLVATPGASGRDLRARVERHLRPRRSQLRVAPLVLDLLGRD